MVGCVGIRVGFTGMWIGCVKIRIGGIGIRVGFSGIWVGFIVNMVECLGIRVGFVRIRVGLMKRAAMGAVRGAERRSQRDSDCKPGMLLSNHNAWSETLSNHITSISDTSQSQHRRLDITQPQGCQNTWVARIRVGKKIHCCMGGFSGVEPSPCWSRAPPAS